MSNISLKLSRIFAHYLEQIPPDERRKILSNLKSPAPLIPRIEYFVRKGKVRPVTGEYCLPGD